MGNWGSVLLRILCKMASELFILHAASKIIIKMHKSNHTSTLLKTLYWNPLAPRAKSILLIHTYKNPALSKPVLSYPPALTSLLWLPFPPFNCDSALTTLACFLFQVRTVLLPSSVCDYFPLALPGIPFPPASLSSWPPVIIQLSAQKLTPHVNYLLSCLLSVSLAPSPPPNLSFTGLGLCISCFTTVSLIPRTFWHLLSTQ